MRLLIVSNRLHVTAIEQDGDIVFRESTGGVATGLGAWLDLAKKSSIDYVWIGWPGTTVQAEMQEKLKAEALSLFQAYPVYLSQEEMENFYHGFCNKTIWAIFHYFPSFASYQEKYWRDYVRVNETFCKVVCEIAQPGDVIWVHDYHLMLLPRMLREKLPENPIGFFLHIPFPSFEVFRLLPRRWRSEILKGLLGSDLIGFHTHDFVQYFLRCVLRILGFEHNLGEIQLPDRIVRVDTFPMGIDFERFHSASTKDEVLIERRDVSKMLDGTKAILSIDRLDYSKGILNRLRGYEEYLRRTPESHGQVILLMIVVPSRVGVEQYQEIKKQIDQTVGRINGEFSRIGWTPIIYQYRSLSFAELASLYGSSDVMLVTPLRDGMNLIAKEYIASRTDGTGVLILSEMAGAAKELGEAIIINPNNIEEIVDALQEAFTMPLEEQKRRNGIMQKRLKRYDVMRWGNEFIQSLLSVRETVKRLQAKLPSPGSREQLLESFRRSKHRLLLLDYDGTLVPFTGRPELAYPGNELLEALANLAKSENTDVVLLSGRDKATMEKWFGQLDIELIAEHGVWIHEKKEGWKLLRALSNDWKSQVLPVFEVYADRLPGSLLEEKEFSLVFHYREADPEMASVRTKELADNLLHLAANMDVQVVHGSKIIEMRNAGVNKGIAARHFISRADYDFVLAIGDDFTDEELFRVLPASAYSIKVGISPSYASYNLPRHSDVIQLIDQIAAL